MACILILAWLGRVIAVLGSSSAFPSGCSIYYTQHDKTLRTKLHLILLTCIMWSGLHFVPCIRLLRYFRSSLVPFWKAVKLLLGISVKTPLEFKFKIMSTDKEKTLKARAEICWGLTVRISLRIVLRGLPSRARDFSLGKVPRPQGILLHTNEKRKSFSLLRPGKKKISLTGFSVFLLSKQ